MTGCVSLGVIQGPFRADRTCDETANGYGSEGQAGSPPPQGVERYCSDKLPACHECVPSGYDTGSPSEPWRVDRTGNGILNDRMAGGTPATTISPLSFIERTLGHCGRGHPASKEPKRVCHWKRANRVAGPPKHRVTLQEQRSSNPRGTLRLARRTRSLRVTGRDSVVFPSNF
jgi:hypothetical protein